MFVGLEHFAPTNWLLSSMYVSELPRVEAAIAEIHTEPMITESANCRAILTIRDLVSENGTRGSGVDFRSPGVGVQRLQMGPRNSIKSIA